MENTDVMSAIAAIGLLRLIGWILAVVFVTIIPIVCYWNILDKAGYNGRWGLLALIPGGQIALLIFLAIAEW